jgi:NAD(P)H dehydrogenase (quinone)
MFSLGLTWINSSSPLAPVSVNSMGERKAPMFISLILAHHDKTSFNHAIASAAVDVLQRSGHYVYYHDLYQEGFDPVLTAPEVPRDAFLPPLIDNHCREISRSRGIIIVHPNWWGGPPALLKGWVDRVIRPGIGYEFHEGDSGEGVPKGLLSATTVMVFNPSNPPAQREEKVFGDPLESFWKNCIFGLCGIKAFHRRTFSVMVTSTPEQRGLWLQEVREKVSVHFPG